MQLYQLKPNHKKKSRKRVGRGGKRGTYSGKGLKGQKARAGGKTRAGFAGGETTLVKRLPKKRGSVGGVAIKKGVKLGRKVKTVVLNLSDIEKKFKGAKKNVISPKELIKKGLVSKIKGRVPQIKILGRGEVKKKYEFKGVKLSKSVQKKQGIKK